MLDKLADEGRASGDFDDEEKRQLVGLIEARKQWSQYQKAYEMLLAATHTPWAPWTIVPANSKTHRNLMIATLVREVLTGLDLRYPPGDPALQKIRIE